MPNQNDATARQYLPAGTYLTNRGDGNMQVVMPDGRRMDWYCTMGTAQKMAALAQAMPDLVRVLVLMDRLAAEMAALSDADHIPENPVRLHKLLCAFAGGIPGYRTDTDEFRAAVKAITTMVEDQRHG